MVVLILAPGEDLHAQAVSSRLGRSGISSVFWDADSFPTSSRVTARFGQEKTGLFIEQASSKLDFASVTAVWLRRPGSVRAAIMPEPWMEEIVEWESSRALQGLWRCIDCLWVNSPAAQAEVLYKLNQLNAARLCGLSVPETLITNDPQQARDFIAAGGECIYKLIDEASWKYFPVHEGSKGMPTMPLLQSDGAHLDQVAVSMHLFQRRVHKLCDIRVTAVGDKLFSARIESQSGKGHVDFRLDYSVPIIDHRLPDSVAQGCLDLMKHFRLKFAAFDFALSVAGDYMFLELNPAGQYLWIEEALGLPISDELALLLAKGQL